ncbi:MAG: hypothetical protein AAFN11_08205 [Chloroflexota bacterium]
MSDEKQPSDEQEKHVPRHLTCPVCGHDEYEWGAVVAVAPNMQYSLTTSHYQLHMASYTLQLRRGKPKKDELWGRKCLRCTNVQLFTNHIQ